MLKSKYISLAVATWLASGLAARADIRDTIQNAKSGTTVTCSGTYTLTQTISVPSGVTVKGPATFKWTTGSSGVNGFIIGTGISGVKLQSLTVQGAAHGIFIYGSGCTVSSCTSHDNTGSGFEIIGTGSKNNTFSSCVAYNNCDSSGGNADGFSAKNNSSTGNKFSNCTAHGNSDDGFDYYSASSPIVTSGCQSYSNGSCNGKTGNGVGFKMGGSGYSASHSFTSCVAHNSTGNTGSGFDSNNNGAKLYLTTCHSYSNKQKDRLVNVSLSNCTMQQ